MIISRIAPTPSGFLHKGNAFNFLLTWLLVRKHQGHLHLRIDDIDQQRVRTAYLEDIFISLEWLGIDWDSGPESIQDHLEAHSQILRLSVYEKFLQNLQDQGLLFACTCSRKEVLSQSQDGTYPGSCSQLGRKFDDQHTAWRINTPWPLTRAWNDTGMKYQAWNADPSLKDAIVRKKDGSPSYQITSIVDDLRMKINLIVRGQDLIGSSVFQQWIMDQSALHHPIQWHHHSLLRDQMGQKLSKSAGARSLRDQYQADKSSDELIREFARWMGWIEFRGHTAQALLQFVSQQNLLPQLI